jgi:ATP/maltotriose-dependent transcriptional regulator MalT
MMGGTQKAARGLLESGRDDVAAGRQLLRELNNVIWWAGTSMVEGDMELSTGDPEIAYAVLAEGSDALSRHAETGYLATVFGLRAQAALRLGREDEALQLASRAEQLAQHDDFEPHARQRLVRAGVLMRRGETATSAELVGEAAAIIAQTDYYILHRDLAFTEAEVERSAGRAEGERRALERALSNAEQKADLVAADRARQRLAEL